MISSMINLSITKHLYKDFVIIPELFIVVKIGLGLAGFAVTPLFVSSDSK